MQQGCKGQMQKEAEEGNRNNGVFSVNMSWIFLISSFVLMLFPKWATEERGKKGASTAVASWLWEVLLFQACQISPAQQEKWTPAITCLPQWHTTLSGSLEEKDLVFFPLPYPSVPRPLPGRPRRAHWHFSQKPRSLLGVLVHHLSLLHPIGKI